MICYRKNSIAHYFLLLYFSRLFSLSHSVTVCLRDTEKEWLFKHTAHTLILKDAQLKERKSNDSNTQYTQSHANRPERKTEEVLTHTNSAYCDAQICLRAREREQLLKHTVHTFTLKHAREKERGSTYAYKQCIL